MVNSFLNYINENKILSCAPILIGVSGGRDSVVLCDLYAHVNINFAIAHCNFGLRNKESDEDENFVVNLAKKYNVPLFITKFNTKEYANEKGISIQMSAREQRVKWFNELCSDNGFEYFATAHHADDAIETYLMNQIRGTGISGLHGILPKQGQVIHPLLFTNREKITEYALANKLQWREDSSNKQTKYLRNKLRHQVIPLLQEINASVKNTFIDNMHRIYATEKIYQQKIEELKKELLTKNGKQWRISITKLKKNEQAPTILYELLKEFGFNFSQCNQVLQKSDMHQSGALFHSCNYELLRNRKQLLIQEKYENMEEEYFINYTDSEIKAPLSLHIESSENTDLIKDKSIAKLDAETLTFPLKIRKWKSGDYFFPLGMKGRKKLVSDFFIDQKVNIFEKQNIWILCSENDIVWILNHRIDNRFKINSKTKTTLTISIL